MKPAKRRGEWVKNPEKAEVTLSPNLIAFLNGLLIDAAYHAPDLIFDAWSLAFGPAIAHYGSPCQAVAQTPNLCVRSAIFHE